MKTFGLSVLVAAGTLVAIAIVGFGFFVSGGGLIYPAVVAWGAGSVFALARQPRYPWLQVAAIGVFVAGVINVYGFALTRMFSPPSGYIQGGPNVEPARPLPLPPPR